MRQNLKYYINPDIPSIIEPSTPRIQKISETIESLNILKTSPDLETRGISQETLNNKRFAGTILTDKYGNAIFPHRDTEGYCGYEMRSNNGKFFSKGGTKGLWFSKFYKEDKTLVICESQIDALSHYQIHQDQHTRYITTSGSLSRKQKELISVACERIGKRINTVLLAADNDSAGKKQNEEIRQLITNMRTEISKPQNAKDWNELLISQKRQEQNKLQKKQMQK